MYQTLPRGVSSAWAFGKRPAIRQIRTVDVATSNCSATSRTVINLDLSLFFANLGAQKYNASVIIRERGYLTHELYYWRRMADGAIMARWRNFTKRDVTNFDGCGFGKYCFISLRLALLMPLAPSHNLLVRGSNPCGGTRDIAGWPIVLCGTFQPAVHLRPDGD